MSLLRKFKRRHKTAHKFLVFAAIVGVSWGLWQILDVMVGPLSPLWSGIIAVVVGITFLVLDDFHLKDLG